MNGVISYLQAENISKSYGDLLLFENISISIDKGQKIALIARNGEGKTSLLNILAGLSPPDTGSISLKSNLSVSFLEQSPEFNDDNTVIDQVFQSSDKIISVIHEYEKIINSEDQSGLDKIMSKMDSLSAWDFEVKIKQILTRLRITDFNQKIATLSGGQKKRIALANALIIESDLLILDEPTNHLDLEMIEWLENYLKLSAKSLLMVTHDRYFLNNICNEIIELDDNKTYTYKGNYSYFLEKREDRIRNFNSELEKSKNLLRKELDWMRRMPQARTTKSKSRIDAFYDLEDKASQRLKDKKVSIHIKSSRLGKKILELHYINKAYDNKTLIKDFGYKFVRGEKIGIIGENGCGKSTLLNIITQNITADSGKIDVGETVKYGYYKQDGIKFKESQKVIDIVRDIAEVIVLGDGKKLSVTQFLNHFLFPPVKHHQQISKLSGGEKRRLYLLTVLMQNPNFLILDEPTNDLDIMTLNVLEEYLRNYDGCVLIVSHDRYFMDKVVDHVFVFEGNGKIKDFPGDYSVYHAKKLQLAKALKATDKKTTEIKKKSVGSTKKKFSYKEKREYEQLEIDIENLNTQQKTIELELESGNLNHDDLIKRTEILGTIIEQINEKEFRWLELDELMTM